MKLSRALSRSSGLLRVGGFIVDFNNGLLLEGASKFTDQEWRNVSPLKRFSSLSRRTGCVTLIRPASVDIIEQL